MKNFRKVGLIVCGFALAAGLVSCSKKDDEMDSLKPGPVGQPGTGNGNKIAHMQVRMIDAPSPYAFSQVNIDIQSMSALVVDQNGQSSWTDLDVNAGVYNVITLINGESALISDNTVIEAGTISQVHLNLGSNNTVIYNGQQHQLNLSGGFQGGLNIQVNQVVDENENFTLMLDFDVAQSIQMQGNSFTLNPVVHSFSTETTGTISGQVALADDGIAIIASNGISVHSTYADPGDGHFMLQGLVGGSYTISIYRPESSQPIVIPNVQVGANVTINLGLILGGG
jgi:hypothetical protein